MNRRDFVKFPIVAGLLSFIPFKAISDKTDCPDTVEGLYRYVNDNCLVLGHSKTAYEMIGEKRIAPVAYEIGRIPGKGDTEKMLIRTLHATFREEIAKYKNPCVLWRRKPTIVSGWNESVKSVTTNIYTRLWIGEV